MSEFVTWDYMLSFGGCMAATALLTQLVKKFKFLKNVDTQIISCVVAILVLIASQLATGGFTWANFALDFVNGVVIAFASNGVYDATKTIFNTPEEK